MTFPEPLDHGLLQRALGVGRDGAAVAGDHRIEAAETRWTFVPRDAWLAGDYTLIVLAILEDLAGNRIGRSFEVASPGEAVPAERHTPTSIPFRIAGR